MAVVQPTSGATMASIHYMAGLDTALYRYPDDTAHRFFFPQAVHMAGEYITFKVSDGKAGSDRATCDPGNTCDQIFTGWVEELAPAIRGKKEPGNHQTFPSDDRSYLKKADRVAARLFADDDDSDTDDEDDSKMARVRRGVSGFMKKKLGGTGVRRRFDFEASTVKSAKTTKTKSPSGQKYRAYYIDGWPFEALQSIAIAIGTMVIDTLMSKFNFMYLDVSVSASKKIGLREFSGRLPYIPNATPEQKIDMLVERSSQDQKCFVPILFWHTTMSNKALSICAMDWSPVEYQMVIAPFEKFIKRSNRHTRVVKRDGSDLKDTDLKIYMILYLLWIDPQERRKIEKDPFDLLIKQHRFRKVSKGLSEVNIKFPHPTLAVMWCIHRRAAAKDNEPFNWWGLFGLEPMEGASIRFNTNVRQTYQPAIFYRLLQPYEKCRSTPEETCSYMYAWCLDLMSEDPTGSINPVKYSEVVLQPTLQEHLEDEDLDFWVFQIAWQLLKHDDGVVIPAYG